MSMGCASSGSPRPPVNNALSVPPWVVRANQRVAEVTAGKNIHAPTTMAPTNARNQPAARCISTARTMPTTVTPRIAEAPTKRPLPESFPKQTVVNEGRKVGPGREREVRCRRSSEVGIGEAEVHRINDRADR